MMNILSYNNILVLALIIVFIIVVVSVQNLLFLKRVKKTGRINDGLSKVTQQVLMMGNYDMMAYDAATNRMVNLRGEMLPTEGMTLQQFTARLHPNEQQAASQKMEELLSGRANMWEMECRWNAAQADAPAWQQMKGYALTTTNPYGQVTGMTLALDNLTRQQEKEKDTLELTTKYRQMFDNLLVPMSFYNKDGFLIDINIKMRELCYVNEAAIKFFRDIPFFETPVFKHDFDPTSHDDFEACQHMYYPDMGIDKYIVYRIRPVFNSKDELTFYSITVHDITSERAIHLEQKAQEKQKRENGKAISDYEHQLQYLLENNNMFVFTSNPEKQLVNFSRSLSKVEYQLTNEEYIACLEEPQQQLTREFIYNNNKSHEPFYGIHRFVKTPVDQAPAYYAISAMPTFDEQGRFTGHFGVLRNVDELITAQEQLKQETERAEQSGKQKSAFLANMTHEIRTPLNAIVGFSDLLQFIDEEKDRQEFLRIILNNCDMLLRLINDILEVSNSENRQLSIEPEDIDFAVVFDDICQTLAQRVQEPGVEFVKDNPYEHLPITADKGRIQQVYTNFVTNAVKHTHEGHIKVGYQVRDGGLYMYCEDTGTGIPKEKQAAIFERFVKLNDFVQGTGLGLNICQSIAKRCGGKIGVDSEGLGHGSTFWLWIPL